MLLTAHIEISNEKANKVRSKQNNRLWLVWIAEGAALNSAEMRLAEDIPSRWIWRYYKEEMSAYLLAQWKKSPNAFKKKKTEWKLLFRPYFRWSFLFFMLSLGFSFFPLIPVSVDTAPNTELGHSVELTKRQPLYYILQTFVFIRLGSSIILRCLSTRQIVSMETKSSMIQPC